MAALDRRLFEGSAAVSQRALRACKPSTALASHVGSVAHELQELRGVLNLVTSVLHLVIIVLHVGCKP